MSEIFEISEIDINNTIEISWIFEILEIPEIVDTLIRQLRHL